jgi:hypothetical protein
MSRALSAAQACGCVRTLIGRRRPIAGLREGAFVERAAAERKVVNSEVQVRGGRGAHEHVCVCVCHAGGNTPSRLLVQSVLCAVRARIPPPPSTHTGQCS